MGVSQRFEICWGCIKATQLGAARITASEVRQIVCFMQESCTVDAVILMCLDIRGLTADQVLDDVIGRARIVQCGQRD